jgi:tetratricopeptide (TPR) repeat protein
LSSARDAAARALAIEPNLPEALLARASIETNFDFNWNGAAQTLSKALALAPADPNIVIAAGNLEIARGNIDRALELYRRAVARSTHKHEHFSPLTWRRRSDSPKRAPNTRALWN